MRHSSPECVACETAPCHKMSSKGEGSSCIEKVLTNLFNEEIFRPYFCIPFKGLKDASLHLQGRDPPGCFRFDLKAMGPTAFFFLLFGHRRYDPAQLESNFHLNDSANAPKRTHALAYARVSSHDQKQDLETQKNKLESHCKVRFESFEVLMDLGSGLNYRKSGLKKLLRFIFQ